MPAAVMLAGDRVASKPIENDNKAFLQFRGEPMFIHVVRELLATECVDSVVIVGPRGRLQSALESSSLDVGRARLEVTEQGFNLVENAMIGYVASLGITPLSHGEVEYQFDDLVHSEHREKPALFLSCDIPLATRFEIDEFLTKADMDRYDYAIGLSDESVLEPYYPGENRPGIRMSYYHLAESRCRHNNLHLGKPLKIVGMHNIERMYELRYQKKVSNVIRGFVHIMRARINTFAALKYFTLLQLARSLGEKGDGGLYEWIRRKNRLENIVTFIGDALGLRVQAVFTRYGGAVLDVDNEKDLQTVERMYNAWMARQRAIYEAGTA